MSEVSVSGRAAQLPACRAAPTARPAGEEISRWLRAVCERFLERVDAANELALQPKLCAGLPAAALAGRTIEGSSPPQQGRHAAGPAPVRRAAPGPGLPQEVSGKPLQGSLRVPQAELESELQRMLRYLGLDEPFAR